VSESASIPEVSADLESLVNAVRAMKEIVEGLTGQRPAMQAPVPRVHFSPVAPNAQLGIPLKTGDLWIASGSGKLHFWNGRLWQEITV
jgi:hypothetical protein